MGEIRYYLLFNPLARQQNQVSGVIGNPAGQSDNVAYTHAVLERSENDSTRVTNTIRQNVNSGIEYVGWVSEISQDPDLSQKFLQTTQDASPAAAYVGHLREFAQVIELRPQAA